MGKNLGIDPQKAAKLA